MSEIQTIENLDEAEEYFTDAWDRLLASRVVYGKIVAMSEGCLAYAKPILTLIHLKRIIADGETMRGVEVGIAVLDADQALAKSSLICSKRVTSITASGISTISISLLLFKLNGRKG